MASTHPTRISGTRRGEIGHPSRMSSSLAEDYLRWLTPQIREPQHVPAKEFGGLLALMFEKEFVWVVHNDANRSADGRDLRPEFCYQQDLDREAVDFLGPASFLEVLIGLARRLAFDAGGHCEGWAWQLLNNLELHRLSDPFTRRKKTQAESIIDACIWRTYRPDGQGGFFPLAWPQEDQRSVELWYQMAAYIDELHPER